jgi:hypothetical protein
MQSDGGEMVQITATADSEFLLQLAVLLLSTASSRNLVSDPTLYHFLLLCIRGTQYLQVPNDSRDAFHVEIEHDAAGIRLACLCKALAWRTGPV